MAKTKDSDKKPVAKGQKPESENESEEDDAMDDKETNKQEDSEIDSESYVTKAI